MKKTKQFIIRLFVALIGLVSLMNPATVAQAQEELNIGILQHVEHESFTEAVAGLQETLDKQADYSVQWDLQNANGDMTTLQSLAEKLVRDNDILVAVGTPAAQTLAAMEKEKPIFFLCITAPIEAGLVDSIEKPGANITGTSNLAPLEDQINLLLNNISDIQTVGMIHNSSEVNSSVLVEEAKKILQAQDIAVEVGTITGSNDIQQVFSSLLEKVDAMLLVSDNTVDSAIALVGDMLVDAGKPSVGSTDAIVRANGMMTISTPYVQYGEQTAQMVLRHLQEGIAPGDMPVEYADSVELTLNEDNLQAIGVDPSIIQE
ncbi:ABC transporter substrate-binding protein [Suicoccus acidiformans]|uniref:ABC transporter substrate-binding protein n=1 Tax=Suicoccus acidiformans TaxID=2036206 RepID=A0A347WNF0_9LACT|nr:ABC transporter substrate-binding protein [Suicoccus acidiformans]AXY26607.1 ABC transporter substrate-binding protein [Suicoccus acidiformans]